ncbi:MAG: A/G-specific adenine glycosylase [Methylococcales bacterium]|nr:A/G-specific adenine glycosylase [Methylococcales bacterium]
MSPSDFQQKILTWFDLYGRKNLPWQEDISPYRVWLSEVMLQQTQVTTVIPYFNQFIQQFPDIHQLANAPIDTVLYLWSGLGYYARARNLHKTAQMISEGGGEFPDDLDQLMLLPGVGRSTAGAISSIAFNQSQPILDGNVRRVLARFCLIEGWVGNTAVSQKFWSVSSRYTPEKRVADYTQAMMDMGAMICTRRQPKCDQCPIYANCLAQRDDKIAELPSSKPKKITPIKQVLFLMLQNKQGQFLLEKRPNVGIWGGLWSLPEYDTVESIRMWLVENNIQSIDEELLDQQRHTFSHFHLDYTPVLVRVENPMNIVMEDNKRVWYKTNQPDSLGLASPIKKLLHNQYSERDNGKSS